MSRVIALLLCVAFGLASLSRSCAIPRPGGPVALMRGRVVSVTGFDQSTRVVAITGGKISAVWFASDHPFTLLGARDIDVTGLYIAAATFDRSAPTLINGLRHVWVGQIGVGEPGNVVILRSSPSRVRPGDLPDSSMIVGAVVDGVYYTARELNRRR